MFAYPFIRSFVQPSLCLIFHLSVLPSVCPVVRPSFISFVRSSVNSFRPFVQPSVRSSVHPSECPIVLLIVRVPDPPSVPQSVPQSVHLFVRSSVRSVVRLFVSLLICLVFHQLARPPFCLPVCPPFYSFARSSLIINRNAPIEKLFENIEN